MLRSITRVVFITLLLAVALAGPDVHTAGIDTSKVAMAPKPATPRGDAATSNTSDVRTAYLRTPLRFERGPREGAGTTFVARGAGYAVHLSGGNATVALKSSASSRPDVVTMRLVGSLSSATASVQQELPGRSNYALGRDRRQWRTGGTAYGRVKYHGIYPGIDLVYYGNQQRLEYDFVVAPGATPGVIAFALDGATDVRVDDQGDLIVSAAGGTIVHEAPLVHQQVNGTRRRVEGSYAVRPDGSVGFRLGEYDSRFPLVIDPILSYSTYLGGANEERIHGVAVDAAGNIVVVGETYSVDFPTVQAVQPERSGSGDAFVAKLNSSGDALVYATYLGGFREDSAQAVDVDATGAVYVAGSSASPDFPVLGGLPSAQTMMSDAFVAKLDSAGALVYSTVIGGTADDYGLAVAVDRDGRAHIAGSAWSADLPIVNGMQPSLGGNALSLTTDGGNTWTGGATGLRTIGVTALAFDPADPGTMYAGTMIEGVFKTTNGGATWTRTGPGLPFWLTIEALAVSGGSPAALYAATQGGLYRSLDGGESWIQLPLWGWATALVIAPDTTVFAGLSANAFPSGVFKSTDGGDTWTPTGLTDGVSALAISGSTLYAATPNGVFTSIGGDTWVQANAGLPSQMTTLAVDPNNPAVAYAGGFDGLFKTTNGGGLWEPSPLLVAVPIEALAIAPSDPATVFASILWGGSVVTNDGGENWRLTYSDSAVASAIAVHPQIATTAYIAVFASRDGFVATLSPDGSRLEYATYFGGSSHDEVSDLALDVTGARIIAGDTMSADLPVRNPVQAGFAGLRDAFAARIGSDGTLTYSTYLGGSGSELAARVAVDPAGQAHVAGLTFSSNYPVLNAHQPQHAGGFSDVFLSVLNSSGEAFVHSTFLGGGAQDTSSTQSLGPDVAVTSSGETYVTGTTMSQNFPTTADAFQRLHAGGQNDAFVTRFDAAGQLQYSSYIGGAGDDHGRHLALGPDGAVIVSGYTNSTNFPVRSALQPARAGTDDGFIARMTDGSVPTDTAPPVTTVALAGTTGLAGWYRSPVVVTLSATDGESGTGVAVTQYRLNGGPLQNYAGPFTISTQGTTQVTAFSIDGAGNVEAAAPATAIKVDTFAPLVTVASPAARDYLFTGTITVTVSSSDSTSGLAGPPVVTVDGVALTGSVLDLSALALGPHTLVASAMDAAGNPSQAAVIFNVVSEIDTVINVPAEAATIQAAIDRAIDGDTVLVAPGTYVETINFLGKAITVTSEEGPARTIIDARGAGSVVTFRSRETRASVLSGFTIRGGGNTSTGGGIAIGSSSPTIDGNIVTENQSCSGVGIYSTFGSPLIRNNKITRNSIHGCTGGWGIGVYIGGNSAAELVGNEISDNTGAAASGGGVALFAAGNATVRGNVIARNVTSGEAGCGWGGGIMTANFSEAKVVGNVIVGNVACFGGGVHWGGSTGSNVFVNNTIADNEGSLSWPGMYVSGFDARNQLHNNIITARTGPALYCENAASLTSPVLRSNDVFSALGAAYGGTCADQTGLGGNISLDPGFVDAVRGDYRLTMASAAIDAGNDSAPELPATDVIGNARIADGNGDGGAHVDLGAFEYRNHAPVADAGQDRDVPAGAGCVAVVTLNGSGSDADADTLRFTWSGPFGTASGPTPSVALGAGSHVIMLTVADGNGGSASDTVVVTVQDSVPPTIEAVSATPSVLMRSNHEMEPVVVSVSVSDVCDAGASCRIESVGSNEPVDGLGDGDSGPDWEITGPLTLNLRAERSGKGTGRVYTVTVACVDAAGNRATSTVTVTVPR